MQFMINLFPPFGWVFCLIIPKATSCLILQKIGCPVNFLVISDDQMTANFEHCMCYLYLMLIKKATSHKACITFFSMNLRKVDDFHLFFNIIIFIIINILNVCFPYSIQKINNFEGCILIINLLCSRILVT